MVAFIQRPQTSKVNARHLLDDLASSYTYGLSEAVLVELVANSLDAKASNLWFSVNQKNGTLALEDDGQGMGPDEFQRYHDLAESQKVRGRGIGFAGLGANLAHQIAHRIVTETRFAGHRDASSWRFNGDDL